MEELVRRKVDVILAAGQEVMLKAAKQATGTIPIVMIAINDDPVALGYVGSLARPGGNITGVFLRQPELLASVSNLLKQTVPTSPARSCSGTSMPPARSMLRQRQRRPYSCRSNRSNCVTRPMITGEPWRPRSPGPVTRSSSRRLYSSFATVIALPRLRIAASAAIDVHPAGNYRGGRTDLLYGTNYPGMFRLAADYVDKILKGREVGRSAGAAADHI